MMAKRYTVFDRYDKTQTRGMAARVPAVPGATGE
jgi:hypothetical protein